VQTFTLKTSKLLAAMGLIVLIIFAFATCADGLLRSLANQPITAVGDVGTYIVAAAVAACFPLAQLQRANITIEMFHARPLRVCSATLVLIAIAAMARQMFLYAADNAEAGDSTVMLSIPTAPFWYAVAAMFTCATLVQLLVVATEARSNSNG
jgi:TRAP-type C4-dicarboxylate transport system permease small subunit